MQTMEKVFRILVVEGNLETGSLCQEALSVHGYDATVAHSAEAGLDLVATLRPAAIACSLALPGVDGFEFAREVRRRPENQGIYLAALTGLSYAGIEEEIAAAGFGAYFRKPLGTMEFIASLTTRLAPREPRGESLDL